MKIMKKPIAVDAWFIDTLEIQYQGNVPDWVWKAAKEDKFIAVASDGHDMVLRIKTREGIMQAKDGDVLVKGVRGELYPIERGIFEETYDIVPDMDEEDLDTMTEEELLAGLEALGEQVHTKKAVESLVNEDGSISVTEFTDLADGSAMCAISMPYDTLLQFARIGLTHVIHREADRVMAEHEDVSGRNI